ncbi:hypothetical protein [Pseudaminobacter sp. NGMCC 1.201702]|uniref:hypothetical protein n=1 Tax=Pseudaminobacter sp. NGMCC 1.201702 TaxID=3391825 RepID=UPI0039EE4B2E
MTYKNCVQDFIDDGTAVTIWCHNPKCHHRGELDLLKLRDRIGPDHGMLFEEIKDYFRCSKCGGKQLGMTRHPLTGGKPNPHRVRG